MRSRRALLLCGLLFFATACDRALEVPSDADLGGGASSDPRLACGTRGGPACPSGSYCDLVSACGAEDLGGRCEPVPDACTDEVEPVCGCDDVTYTNDCERRTRRASLKHKGACDDPCAEAGGYCALGDFVKPTCGVGYREGVEIEAMHEGVCGLGICCVPRECEVILTDETCEAQGCTWSNLPETGVCFDDRDCKIVGCAPGLQCSGCLTPTGVESACLPDGAAC